MVIGKGGSRLVNAPHSTPSDEVVRAFTSDVLKGLEAYQVQRLQEEFGKNEIRLKDKENLFVLFFKQFHNPVVYLLLIAAATSFAFKDYTEGIAIIIVTILNALIGFIMELQARYSMNALKRMDAQLAKVWRDGRLTEVNSIDLVPGDMLTLEGGDIVQADARIVSAEGLEVDESILTGESIPILKRNTTLEKDVALADRTNMLYKGSSVVKGSGRALVTSVGMETEFGKIARTLNEDKPEKVPMNDRLEVLGKRLIFFMSLLFLALVVTGIIRGYELHDVIKMGVALAVAAIPEGLPVVATIALAAGMVRLARDKVLAKKLSAVETLGSTTVILSDKTGTLTLNKLKAHQFFFSYKSHKIASIPPEEVEQWRNVGAIAEILKVSVLCNNAVINSDKSAIGDPIEVALLEILPRTDVDQLRNSFPRLKELPFDSDSKLMATFHEHGMDEFVAVKGAPEELLKHASFVHEGSSIIEMTETHLQEWTEIARKASAAGMKVIGLAHKSTFGEEWVLGNNLVFTGMVAFLDPLRPNISQTITETRKAGVKVVMVTGDHLETARTIALKAGIITDVSEPIIHGYEMNAAPDWSESEAQKYLKANVFARVTPSQKMDLIKLHQKHGAIVGMTGDGVNDAPALQMADIGVAMGKAGTQVARDAADLVLKDDSFASITRAIRFGRTIYKNIRTFIIYLLSCNLSEILLVGSASFITGTIAMLPIQLLFLNMITDVFPAVAIGMSQGTNDVMQNQPRDPKEPIISKDHWLLIILYASAICASVLIPYLYSFFVLRYDEAASRTIAFFTLGFAQLVHPWNFTSSGSLFNREMTQNKYLWWAILLCVVLMLGGYVVGPLRSLLGLTVLKSEAWLWIFIGAFFHLILIKGITTLVKHKVSI